MPYLLVSYFSIFAILSYRKIEWAIFVIILALPSYAVRFSVAGLPMTLLEGMILILFFVWAYKEITNKENRKLFGILDKIRFPKCPVKWRFKLPIYLFIFFATLSVFISPNKQAALGIWKAYFIEPFLFVIVFVNIFQSHSGQRKTETSILANPFLFITTALSIPALYISFFAIYQKITGFLVPPEYWQAGYHRVTSFFSYPNAIGLLLAPMVILFLGIVCLSPSSQRRGLGGGVIRCITLRLYFTFVSILSILAIFFAQSEGAIIGLAGGLLVFCFLYNKKTRLAVVAILLLAVVVGGSVYVKYGKQWDETFNTTTFFELDDACDGVFPCKIYQKLTFQDVSGTIRREMWNETFQMLKQKPIFGAGLAGYQNAMENYHTKDYVEIYLYPHNIILNFWSEIGLFGLLAFIWMVVMFFYNGTNSLSSPFYKGGQSASACRSSRFEPEAERRDEGDSSRKQSRIIKITLISSMSVLLIHGLVDVPYFKNDLAILFWIIFGMMLLIDMH
ncbi:O-antigen ligase family protein [Patescibacteria group bacterium]